MSFRPRAGVAAAALSGADGKSPSTDIVAKLFANLKVAGPDTEVGRRNRGEYDYGDGPESDDDGSTPYYEDEFFQDGNQVGGGDGYRRSDQPRYATFEYEQRQPPQRMAASESEEERAARQREDMLQLFEEYMERRGANPSGNEANSDPVNRARPRRRRLDPSNNSGNPGSSGN
jgi:hypothetical protein